MNHAAQICKRLMAPGHWRRLVTGLLAGCSGWSALANPDNLTVSQGRASTVRNGSRLDVTASHNAVLDWQRFNIGKGETTAFHQPSAYAVVWNRIWDQNPSQILGRLEANGVVVLMNQNGFYFGRDSQILVGGLVVTTVPVSPTSPMGGGLWQFQGSPPAASIINYGEVKARNGGSVFLISEKIENHGTLAAPDGTLALYAGKEVLLSERPDGRGLSANVRLPEGSVDNTGKLIADAGTLALHAAVVNNQGIVQANSVRERHGVIEFVATEAVKLGSQSVLEAKGDAATPSPGGTIRLKSDAAFSDTPGSRLDVSGGARGGDAGSVELSAPRMPAVRSELRGQAQPGWQRGHLFLDPLYIELTSADDASSEPAGQINAGDYPDWTLRLNVNYAFAGFGSIHLQALRDITLEPYTVWSLNDSPTGGSLLTLEAGRDIVFGDNARIVGGAGWSVRLAAGVDFTAPTPKVRAGLGSIYLNGGPADARGVKPNVSGAIETLDGNIDLSAGQDVFVGSGYVRTTGGGNLQVSALQGDVDAGTKNDTYDYSRRPPGYAISQRGLGGIGTAAGGDVSIVAGHDIESLQSNIGAFGQGNGPDTVSLKAGRDIKGHFLARYGIGSIQAGRDVGDARSPVSLGLISGGWNVTAARDLFLNEVFNPNGALNPNKIARQAFRFDYAPNAFVKLAAGNSVQLLGTDPVRAQANSDRPVIYPPQLDITAGPGGVVLGNDLILYPSALSSLHVRTTGGGGLRSQEGGYYQLVISDADSVDYADFAAQRAAIPLHLQDSQAQGYRATLDISGLVQNLFFRSPMAALMTFGHNALNFAYEGQNLSVDSATRLRVKGDILSRSDRTYVTLAGVPDLSILDPLTAVDQGLAGRLSYDPSTHQLGLQGALTPSELAYLLYPTIYLVDPRDNTQVVDEYGQPIIVPAKFTADAAALRQLFRDSQDVPTSTLAYAGLRIGGPGTFEVSARNLDLGVTAGIRSVGAQLNPALARIPGGGASLKVDLAGNLGMTASQIASFNGGDIDITAHGRLDIGSQGQFTSDDTPKGIYTAHGGHVYVAADSDINVSGSRIATYDGGDIQVESLHGSVDAGLGGRGLFSVTTSQFNPDTGLVESRNDVFFGSGIMTLTRPDSDVKVGNILVKAAQNISANAGGVLQIAFNAVDQSQSKVVLDAGGSILANESGILGGDVSLKAGGDIIGLVVANRNMVIDARQNVNVTALAAGTASVKAGDNVSGSIVGGGNVSVSGSEINAAVISTTGSASAQGDKSGAKMGAFANVAAPAVQKATQDAEQTVAGNQSNKLEEEEEQKKKRAAAAPALSRSTGRVTVILPNP